MLKQYLDQLNPKIVLFEVGYKTFSSDGVEGAMDIITNSEDFDWAKEIKAILIQTPILQKYYSSIQNMHEFSNYFKKVSKDVEFYDFNGKIYSDTNTFTITTNLNALGVERFNKDLVEAIKPHLRVMILTDH